MKCQEFVVVEGLQINLKILKAVAFSKPVHPLHHL